MTNTFAINTTRGKEFEVEAELKALGANPWVPKLLCTRRVKEKGGVVWYDRAYVPKLLFCVFPAVMWNDVLAIKHVIGRPIELSRVDIEGRGTRNGLREFQRSVDAEYSDMEARRENAEWVCAYEPGQALQILTGAWQDVPATFQRIVRDAKYDHPMLEVSIEMMGRQVTAKLAPLDAAIAT